MLSKHLKYIFLVASCCMLPFLVISETDPTPPTIISEPTDTIFSCLGDVELNLRNWYESHAGMVVTDNSDTFNILALQELDEVLDSLEASRDSLCLGSAITFANFYALDTCNNSTDTLTAFFTVEDKTAPIMIIGASQVEFDCTFGIQDSLDQWLLTQGGALARDQCTDTIIWTGYFWNDNVGNSGFVNYGEPSSVTVQRNMCDWFLTVSFFVEDFCGNTNVTNGNFSIKRDTFAPIINFTPADTTLTCDAFPYMNDPEFIDGCDPILSVELIEDSSQHQDESNCEHYNYELMRTWIASDVCGNTSSTVQIITVIDTTAPTANFEDFELVNCLEDIDMNFDNLIEVSDNCSAINIDFDDGQQTVFDCKTQFERTWTIEDACGNAQTFVQTIQQEDLSPPQISSVALDTIIECTSNTDIELIFENWISNNGGAISSDPCSPFIVYPLREEDYVLSDPNSIIEAEKIEINYDNCSTLFDSIIVFEEVHFVHLDTCGNASVTTANFIVVDVEPPSFVDCFEEIELLIDQNSCEQQLILSRPMVEDQCNANAADQIEYTVVIDDEILLEFQDNLTLNISLEAGAHELVYIATDCGKNSSSCIQTVRILDQLPPVITCPPNLSLYLADDACQVEASLPTNYTIQENCQTSKNFNQTQPDGIGFINFSFNSDLDTFTANNIFLEFRNATVEGTLSNPKLNFFFSGDTDDSDEYFTVLSELGENLGDIQLDGSSCQNSSSVVLNLDENSLLNWAADGTIFFTLIPNEDAGDGINPCNDLAADGTDESSFLRANLSYTDLFPDYDVRDPLGEPFTILSFGDSIVLDQGVYTVNYSIEDASGNSDDCNFLIEVLDTISPSISCEGIDTIIIGPSLADLYRISSDDFFIDADDNCGIKGFSFDPPTVDCIEIGNEIDIEIIAEDESGNESICDGKVVTVKVELQPQIGGGLCVNDTIQLFANHQLNDVFNVLSYFWTGPNNFVSIEENPLLPVTGNNLSGTYLLELADANGCVFLGSIDVEVESLSAPVITATQTEICEGESLLLNSNSFIQDVNYLWYEGISPNGVLLQITTGPSYQLTPSAGQHFYYVDIEGESCNTNASNTIEISVDSKPTAQVSEPFITVCEGDRIVLSSDMIDNGLEFQWTGPSGYQSQGQFPEVISNATKDNEGFYTLVVTSGGCVSDPATVQVVVFDIPQTPIISGESVFCEGSNFLLSVNNVPNAQQYLWYKDGALNSSLNSNNLVVPSAQSNLSGEWSVVVQDGFCSSDTSDVFVVNVLPSFSIGATNDGPVCDANMVTISASFIPDASYFWTSPTGINYTDRIATVPAEQGVYTVEVTTSANCSNTASTNVEILSIPLITALSNSSTPCMNAQDEIVFVPTVFPPGQYEYEWIGPNGFSSNEEFPSITALSMDVNGVYTLNVFDGNCNADPATTVVDIQLIPDHPEIEIASFQCLGDELLIETNAVAEQYVWITPTGQIETSVGQLLISNSSISDIGFYQLQIILNGCMSDLSDSLFVELMEEPDALEILGDDLVCENEEIVLEVELINGATYQWIGPQGAMLSNDNILMINNADASNIGEYQLIYTIDGCVSQTAFKTVEVIDQIDAPSFSDDLIEACLITDQTVNVCFSTMLNAGDSFILIDSMTLDTLAVINEQCFDLALNQFEGRDSVIISGAIFSQSCFSNNALALRLLLYPAPLSFGNFALEEIIVCDTNFAIINLNNLDDLDISISSDDSQAVLELNNDELTIRDFSRDSFQVFISSTFEQCENFGFDTLQVIVRDKVLAEDDTVNAAFETSVNIEMLNNDFLGEEFRINILEGTTEAQVVLDGETIDYTPGPFFIGVDTIIYQLCVDACPNLCSQASIFITVGSDDDCKIGNLITPNADGINDAFVIPCLDPIEYPNNEVIIFNQWGDQLFSASPYLNNWSGTHNGQNVPAGTYYFVLNRGINGNQEKGFIVLER